MIEGMNAVRLEGFMFAALHFGGRLEIVRLSDETMIRVTSKKGTLAEVLITAGELRDLNDACGQIWSDIVSDSEARG